MDAGLRGRRVAILATDGVEQVELVEPREALEQAGATVELVSPKGERIQAFEHHDKGRTFEVDRPLEEAHAGDYDALFLPGGVINPDALRTEPKAVQFVREFMVSDKPVAAICHGPWLLVEADVIAGRTLTSWPSLKRDIRNAGAEWVDTAVKVDGRLITSRKPDDLPQFTAAIVREFASGISDAEVDRLSEQSFPASDPPPGPTAVGGGGATRNGESDARA